jgi:hypothetical protein
VLELHQRKVGTEPLGLQARGARMLGSNYARAHTLWALSETGVELEIAFWEHHKNIFCNSGNLHVSI